MWMIFIFLASGCSILWKDQAPLSAKGSVYIIHFSKNNWLSKVDEHSDYVVENEKDGRIMLSNSFCKEFQDQSLELLANNTFKSISDFQAIKGEYLAFHNREAYRLDGSGSVDGVKVNLSLLNTRRDNCYFDFLSISPINHDLTLNDFDSFLKSVEFK